MLVLGPVPNTSLGIVFDLIILTSVFLIFRVKNQKKSINKSISFLKNIIYVPFIYILFISIPISIITNDFSFSSLILLARGLKIIITFHGCLALVLLYKKKYNTDFFNVICLHLLYVILINSLLMFSQLLIPQIKSFFSTILYNNISEIHFQTLFRVGGLYLSGGALASVFQGIGILLLPFLYKQNKINFIQTVLFFLILFLSIIITGRTGLVLIPLSVFLFLKDTGLRIKLSFFLLFLLLISFSSEIFLMIESLVFKEDNELLSFNFERLLRFSVSSGNSDIYSTVDVIFNKFSFSNDVKTIFFGDLNFSNYGSLIVSDMGWNLILYKFGLLGILFYYTPFFTILSLSFKKKNIDKSKSFFTKTLILSFLLFEFKEQIIYARNGYSILLLITVSYLLIEYKENSLVKNN
jgi:hypothetical protein